MAQIRTTTIQDARATVMACMLPEMADDASSARSALRYLAELQPGLKAAAVFGSDGALKACEGDRAAWERSGVALLELIDASVEAGAVEAHIATRLGEVFLQSRNGCRLVAVAERFVLASLFSFDMRAVLRELEGDC